VSPPGVSSALRRWAWATLVANLLLIVTGGAVRLTGSGLGCPTWPRCDSSSFIPHGAMTSHRRIEFGNRTLTFVLVVIAVATFIAAREEARRRGRADLLRLSVVLALAIPAQAVLGGITVLTDLNPWLVSLHLVLSLGIVSTAVLFLYRLDHPPRPPATGIVPALAWTTYAVTWLVLYAGTVVTGSGPHAGDARSPRNGFDPLQVSQFHADLVFLLIGLTTGMWFALRATGGDPRPVAALAAVEVLQAAVGFVQYFGGLPVGVVMLHMLGAGLVVATATWLLVTTLTPVVPEGALAPPPVVEEGALATPPVVEKGAPVSPPVVEEGALAPVSKPPRRPQET
jgi:cytochrome c oxidase assembly protein subunit 15